MHICELYDIKVEGYVCTLEQAKKLKEHNFPQKSIYYYDLNDLKLKSWFFDHDTTHEKYNDLHDKFLATYTLQELYEYIFLFHNGMYRHDFPALIDISWISYNDYVNDKEFFQWDVKRLAKSLIEKLEKKQWKKSIFK